MNHPARRLLLSGAQGLLGRSVAAQWLASATDAEVVGFGRSRRLPDRYPYDLELGGRLVPAGLPTALRGIDGHPRYRYVSCSLGDRERLDAVVAEAQPQVVIHSAAALRDDSVSELVRVNIEGTAMLVECCAAAGMVERFVLVSSGAVVGRPQVDHPLGALFEGPVEPYAISKRAGEQMAAAIALRAGLRLAVARVFNLIGPALQARHLPADVAARLEAVRRGSADPVLELGDLSTRRDLVSVDDAARALVAMAAQPEPADKPGGALIDVGSGTSTLMRDLVAMLVEAAGLTGGIDIRETSGRPFDAPAIIADTRALEALGARPATPLTESCSRLMAYLAAQWDATG